MDRAPVLTNVRWLAAANLAVRPVWFLFLLFSSRLLGPVEFGRTMFAISFVTLVGVLFEGGVDVLVVRRLSTRSEQYPAFLAHSSLFKLVGAGLLAVTAVALTFVVPTGGVPRALIAIAAVYVAFNALMLHFRAVFRAFEVLKYEAYSVLVEKIGVTLICGAVLLVSRKSGPFLTAYALAYAVGAVFTLVLLVRRLGLPAWRIDTGYLWRDVIRPALPFALMNVFIMVYFRSGTFLLETITGRDELVGYYNAGYRLVESYMLLPSVVVGPLYPVLSRRFRDRESVSGLLFQATRAILFVSMLVTVPLCVFHRQFTALLFGDAYAPAAPVVGVVALTMIPVGLNFVFGTMVAAADRQGRANVFIILVTVLNLAANAVLIPVLGILGAAWTTVATEAVLAFANMWVVRDCFGWREHLLLAARLAAPALAVAALVRWVPEPSVFPLRAALAVLLLLGSYAALKVVAPRDVRRLVGAR
jgi:O-antigen/teichoic acid export membrane protein